jgi:dihydrofolate synthase/folylpolyglutamate synthase
MTYDEAVRYLLALGKELAAPRQARVQKFDLENITRLAERMGSPHRRIPCVHIAGTNGKGSTAAMLESILYASGARTGLYTSPHLERINERIRVNGLEIYDHDFAAAATTVHALIEQMLASGELAAHPTYFECITAMAFDHFARSRVEFSIYETGLGGRLDATNIVQPEVAVITQIDFDHEEFLGHSIEQIAGEKAGILKSGAAVVSAAGRGEAGVLIRRRAAELHVPIEEFTDLAVHYRLDEVVENVEGARARAVSLRDGWQLDFQLPLPGRYQLRNALTAIATARALGARRFPVVDDAIASGLAAVRWPGRLERVARNPDIYLDGTHNPSGARELAAFWQQYFAGRAIHLVFGAVRDKAVDEVAGMLFPHAASVILTAARTSRAISPPALADLTAHHASNVEVIAEPELAFERALERAQPGDAVFITGSLYLVGDLRRWWRARPQRQGAAPLDESNWQERRR